MSPLMLKKHTKTKIVATQYFKSEDIQTWCSLPISEKWVVVYPKGKKRTGHRYQLTCTKRSEQGYLYSKDIICFSKKEALYLKNKIERMKQHYITQIKRLY